MLSIRRFLLITLTAVVVCCYTLTAYWSYAETEDDIHRVFHQHNLPHDNDLARELALQHMLPFAITLPVLVMLFWWLIGYAFKPLRSITQQLNDREYDNLNPIPVNTAPWEIVPTLTAMNALFERLNAAYEREKRFTADAAHELRTPLAGIRTMAQLALSSKDVKSCHASLDDVIRGVDRCTHVIKQLTVLSSFRPEAVLQDCKIIDVKKLMDEMANELRPLAQQKNITMHVDVPNNIQMTANYACMQILLRNLIDNAIRYSPDNSTLTLTASKSEGRVSLHVIDQGPGIPEELRTRVFERFYRQLGTQTSGTGLGLSIVATICQIHHATITLDNNPKGPGLSVTVTFKD